MDLTEDTIPKVYSRSVGGPSHSFFSYLLLNRPSHPPKDKLLTGSLYPTFTEEVTPYKQIEIQKVSSRPQTNRSKKLSRSNMYKNRNVQ